jgi:hypothetical protein
MRLPAPKAASQSRTMSMQQGPYVRQRQESQKGLGGTSGTLRHNLQRTALSYRRAGTHGSKRPLPNVRGTGLVRRRSQRPLITTW